MLDQTHRSVRSATAAPTVTRRVPALWLVLLAGPISFGITGPALILDAVAAGIRVSVADATWLVSAFGWGIAVGTPLLAGLITRRGVPAVVGLAAVLVAAGALLVLALPIMPALIAGSGLQAIGAAGLAAIAMALAGSPRRMGLVTSAMASFGAVAPLIGSLVADALSWRVVLAMPVLSLLAAPAVARRVLGGGTGEPFDGRGAALLTATVTGLVLIPRWPAAVACALAAAALLALHVRVRPEGFVPGAVVRAKPFLGAAGLALALAIVNFGNVFAVSALLARRAGWDADAIGAALVWPLLLGGTLSWGVVAASTRIRPLWMITTFTTTITLAVIVSIYSGSPLVLLIGLFVGSLSASSANGWLALRAQSAARPDDRPAALGLYNLCYLLGVAFGPALAARYHP